ncbi:MAG: insulinase family protein [Planctomycetes bacterium]|nr:insulinase family protein [Planctomycetota bacterium]
MRLFLSSLLLLPVLGGCSGLGMHDEDPYASPTAKAESRQAVFPYAYESHVLRNGLKLVMIKMPSDGLVSYWSIVRTGSRDEVEPGVTGFAHFFEHMMFRGTKTNPGPVYDRIVNGMGADANAFTSDDLTAYHLSVSKSDLPKVIEIEADRFQHLEYDPQQFKTESGAVYGEYRKGRSSPFEVLDEATRAAAFDQHTYKHTTIGFEADIKAMPERYDYSKTFFQRFYRPENVVLLVVGDIDTAATLAEIEKRYDGWKTGYQAPKVPVEPPQTAQRRLDVPFDGQTLPLLALNFKGCAFEPGNRTAVAARVGAELAFGETSPLYKKLVLDEQRLEFLGTGFDPNRDPGLWTVYAMVKDPKDVPAVEAELWSTIGELQKQPVAETRLDAVRSNMRYSFLSNLGTPDDVCQSLARYVAWTGDITCVDQLFTTLAKLTPDDVRAAASKWLVPANSTVAILHTKGQDVPSASGSTQQALVPARSGADALAHFAYSDPAVPAMNLQGARVSQRPVLMPVPQDPTVSFRIWIQCGSQDDPAGKEGLANIVGSLVSEGATMENAYDQILQKLYPMATGYGVSVDREMTVVTGRVHKDHLDDFYRLLVQAITQPAFTQADFERVRDGMVSGIENQLRFASGEDLAKATLYERIFALTPYAHIDSGTVQSLKALTIEDVRGFWTSHWTRDNLVIGIEGSFPPDLPGRMAQDLGVLAAGQPPVTPLSVAGRIEGHQVVLVDNPSASGSSISVGAPIDLHRGSREYYALWIANSWLGEHRNSSSHLYNVIREERGINYGDYSYIEAYPNGGRRTKPPSGVGRRSQIFELWVRTVPIEKTLFSLRAALRETDKLVANGLTQEQFDFTKKFLKGYSLHFAESAGERLGYAIDDRFFGCKDDLATFRKLMDEITLEECNAAIRKYMKLDDAVIAIVTKDAKALAAALASGDPSPIQYGEGITKRPEILAEDEEIAKYPLKISAGAIQIVPVAEMFESSAKP